MPDLSEIQDQFMLALQSDQSSALLDKIKSQGNLSSQFRINLYRHAYNQRLKETLETDHEILGFFLGDDLFDQMVTEYIKAYPSQQNSLRYFSDCLPYFLAHNKPFNEYPIISDLARFERLLLTAFDAPDSATASVDCLINVAPELWPQLRFNFHPSVQLYHSLWNTVEVWQALKQQQAPPIADKKDQHWLVWRNAERLTEFSSLNPIELSIFNTFLRGYDYAYVCEQLASQITEDKVSELSVQCLVNWLNNGIVRAIVGTES